MSSSADGFLDPNQGRPITAQLEHGIRGLQIDAYLGVAEKGRVYTDLAGASETQATDLSPAVVASAKGIRRKLGAPPASSPTDVYLCHMFCEVGAVRFSTIAHQIRTFLDDHKGEVLTIVIEDHAPTERIRKVLQEAGLAEMLLNARPGQPIPTLGAMVRSGTRLFVSLENGDGGPTLPNAFAGLVEETPYTFVRASSLASPDSCRPNRGVEGSPILQLNHWLTPPTRITAKTVNSTALRARVQQCATARGRPPTLVAVDFADNSDVLPVVRDLNGGERPH